MQKTIASKTRPLRARGQATIEAMLLIALLLGASSFIGRELRQNEWLAQLVSGPWSRVQNLIENGGWQTKPEQHPNFHSRHSSPWPIKSKDSKTHSRHPATKGPLL